MARTKAGSPYSAISFLPVDSPLVRWIGFLSESDGAHLASLATIGLGVFLRWTTALNGYSGAGKPPMFGDFEAQRHWMEITYHLPPSQWYFYDLQYWGLDYPPLTAFVSWLCGAAAQFVDPAFVALDASRGIEGPSVKVFMRWTVLVTELLVYLPALYWFARVWKWDWASRDSLFALLYLQPALILVDHGHFQYNAIMLGLAVGAFTSFVRGRYVLGSCFFVLSLMFKQMALYYSLPVFVFLLSKCVWDSNRLRGFSLLVKLGVTVLATSALCLLPWLNSPEQLLQIVHRVFPVARGLYEDKVANFWCALNVAIKLRELFPQNILALISIGATLLASAPSLLDLFLRSDTKRLLYSLTCVSMSFFLFSFQVHEKTILVPLLPISMLAADEPRAFFLAVDVACFSMFPLLKKDELVLAFFVLLGFWNWSVGRMPGLPRGDPVSLVIAATYLAMLGIHILDAFFVPPARLPDLFVVLNVLVSCAVFGALWAYFTWKQWNLPVETADGVFSKGKSD